MLLRAIFIFLFVSLTFAANWQYEIYVNSSFGVNTTSCWNGGDQTPCVTLNLALQGLQHNSTVIYLYPGTYILDNTSKVIDKSNIVIIGLTTKDGGKTVTIKCSSHSGLLFLSSTNITLKSLVLDSCNHQINPNREFDFRVSAVYISNIHLVDIVLESDNNIELNQYSNDDYGNTQFGFGYNNSELVVEMTNDENTSTSGVPFYINAIIKDSPDNKTYHWRNDLRSCIISGPASFDFFKHINCTKISIDKTLNFKVLLFYNSTSKEDRHSDKVILSIQTQGPLTQKIEHYITVTLKPCKWPLQMKNKKQKCVFVFQSWFCCSSSSMHKHNVMNHCGKCNNDRQFIRPSHNHSPNCLSKSGEYYYLGNSPIFYDGGLCSPLCGNIIPNKPIFANFSTLLCAEGRTGRLCGTCAPGYGVPINHLNRCVICDQHPLPGWVIFILIQLLPVTIMVFIIIVFNIQLTNGFMNGLVFYFQIVSVVYPGLTFNRMSNYYKKDLLNCNYYHKYYYVIFPCNIFNWNFLVFLYHYPLCITHHMTPLQAISFWYIIPTYPLVLLFLIYIWITMYDKGFRCVVTITRPLHRLLARFWRMTTIEPCLIHSTASIYLLCFTQFTATSLQLLHPTTWSVWNNTNDNGIAFFYDGTLEYFGWPHSFAGMFAIVVLVFIIFLPMLYIQLYPFKLFHKLPSCLHLRKEMLITLGDIFSGPFKNGSGNTFDYRYFPVLYFFLRIIVLCLHFTHYENGDIIIYCQLLLFLGFSGVIIIFRPYKRNIHNLSNFFIFKFLAVLNTFPLILKPIYTQHIIFGFSQAIFGAIIIGYIPYWTIKRIYKYSKANKWHKLPSNEEYEVIEPTLFISNEHSVADRIEHPDDYDEQHVQYAPYDLAISQPEENNTICATYGSTSPCNPETIEIISEIDYLSTRDTRSTVAVSERLSIPLYPIASEPDDANSISDDDDF